MKARVEKLQTENENFNMAIPFDLSKTNYVQMKLLLFCKIENKKRRLKFLILISFIIANCQSCKIIRKRLKML